MKGIRRIRQRLCALPLALACLAGLAACGGPDFGSFSKELTFGDKQISDTQTTYVMKIPEGKLGDLIGPSQIQWVIDQYGDPPAHTGAVAVGTKKAAKDLLRKSPELQCRALENTYQEESSDEGKWEYKDSSCRKQRKLSWLEKTLWNMYQVQSDSTIEWLSTSRNTLVAADDTVSTLQANATPNYDSWFAPVNRYLRIAQGVLVAAAAISLIVLTICFVLVPVDTGLMLSFVLATAMLILGMGLFTLGAEMSMSKIGNYMGAKLTKSRRLGLILIVSFLLGVAITVAEPDLQVLAANVPEIDKTVLILTVSVGVGIFLMLCMVRILFGISLRLLLIVFYVLVFLAAFLSDQGILAVAFDSGGVTTGPMTVPFIMALGVGVASIRSDENAKADSFGLVGLCSIGPIASVLLLGAIYKTQPAQAESETAAAITNTVALGRDYLHAFPEYLKEVTLALLPIVVFFLIFQIVSLRLRKLPFLRVMVGILYTYAGLVLFLTGVNVGFSPVGYALGAALTEGWKLWLLIPLAMLMGWFIINAEPAVHILNRQVEDLSAGAISARAMGMSLSIAVSAAGGLAMLRVITGVSIMYFLVPGYFIALALSFFVPRTFTAIAFDSGGVASGPLTATFMLPFAMGACEALGENVMTDAFGLVALVAMMPLITVQVMGAIYVIKSRRAEKEPALPDFGDNEIIELWEAC